MDFSLPPGNGTLETRREGDRWWLYSGHERAAGLAFGLLTALLALVAGLAWLESGDLGKELALGAVVVVPLGALSLYLGLRTPCRGVLDLAEQRLWRVNWITGRPVESRATRDLWLQIWYVPPGEETTRGNLFGIAARGPGPTDDERDFEVVLWSDMNDEGNPRIEEAYRELLRVAPWKGVCDRVDFVRETEREFARVA